MMEISEYLQRLEEENRLRKIPEEGTADRIDLLSNDYLGLGAREEEFREEFQKRFGDAAFTSSASRLLSRRQKYHNLLEQRLEELYGRPALLFNSGYHANTGIISALGSLPDTIILADKLIHASAIDGLKLSGADYKRFPHNDMKALERLLDRFAGDGKRIIVIVESVYSMDGDLAPLGRLVELKRQYPGVMLMVDEAHGFGVFGERGLGLCEATSTLPEIDLIVGTLGKAAASAGAFVVGSREIIGYLLNTSRSFIFSTALPPAQQAWTLLMVEKIVKMKEERENLHKLSRRFCEAIKEITGKENNSGSQIVPFMVGDAGKAVALAGYLREHGYDTLPIRRPTVAAGTERIRFSLNASLTEEQLLPLLELLKSYPL